MDHSKDLIEKLNALSGSHQKIAIKLLNYIQMGQHSGARVQNLIKEDIRELLWEENMDDTR